MGTRELALRALERLDAATPPPPPADAEPEVVIGRGEEVLLARDEALRHLADVLAGDPHALRGVAEAIRLRAAIDERAAVWQAALTRARHLTGERVQAVSRLRQLTRR